MLIKVAFFNSNGLTGKVDSILDFAKLQNIDIFFIVETWLSDNTRNYFSNTFINVANPRQGIIAGGRRGANGVMGFCSNPDLLPQIQVVFQDPNLNFVFIRVGEYILGTGYFAPSLADIHITRFFDKADSLSTQFTEPIILMGDFNARLGALTNDTMTNQRGPFFMRTVFNFPLNVHVAGSGRFTTFANAGAGVTDLVISNDVNIRDFRIWENEPLGGSDHRPLTFEIHINTPMEKQFTRWNVKNLMHGQNRLHFLSYLEHTAALVSQSLDDINEVLGDSPQDAVDAAWTFVRDWYDAAALETVGVFQFKTKVNQEFMNDPLRVMQADIAQKALNVSDSVKFKFSITERRRRSLLLTEANRRYRAALQERRTTIWTEYVDQLGSPQSMGSFLKMTKNLKARSAKKSCALDPTKMREHEDYFRRTTFGAAPTGNPELFTGDFAIPDDLIYTPVVWTPESLHEIIKKIPTGKAAGDDGIMGEFVSYGAEISAIILSELFNIINIHATVPTQWRTALVVPIFKSKGSDKEIKNYRPISLTCVIRRVYERRLMLELAPQINRLSDFQGGFRSHRSTLDQILYLEEVMEENHEAKNIFLDIQAAYDTVDPRILWSRLYHKLGVPWSVLKRIQMLFNHNIGILLIAGKRSEAIEALRGLLQGSSLSPLLFNFYIDDLLELLSANGLPKLSTSGLRSNALAFADDLNLHGVCTENLQRLLGICEEWSLRNGIRFAPSKCFVVGDVGLGALTLYNEPLPVVRSATYLGMVFTKEGVDWEASFAKRFNSARGTIVQLSRLGFNGSGWSFPAAVTVYKSFIRSQMEYGMGLRILPTAIINKAQQVQNLALRTLASAHRTVSRNALSKLFLVESMELRNQQLNVSYACKLHNSTDASIPAVRMWRNKLATRHRKSLTTMATQNPLWRGAFKLNHLTNPLVRGDSIPRKAYTKQQYRDQRFNFIKSLDRDNINVAGCVTVLESGKHLHCLLPAITANRNTPVDRKQRLAPIHWLLGITARHQVCSNCQKFELSRSHALACSGVLRELMATYGHLLNINRPMNLLSQLFVEFKEAPPPDFYTNVERWIAQIQTRCLDLDNAEEGFESRQVARVARQGLG